MESTHFSYQQQDTSSKIKIHTAVHGKHSFSISVQAWARACHDITKNGAPSAALSRRWRNLRNGISFKMMKTKTVSWECIRNPLWLLRERTDPVCVHGATFTLCLLPFINADARYHVSDQEYEITHLNNTLWASRTGTAVPTVGLSFPNVCNCTERALCCAVMNEWIASLHHIRKQRDVSNPQYFDRGRLNRNSFFVSQFDSRLPCVRQKLVMLCLGYIDPITFIFYNANAYFWGDLTNISSRSLSGVSNNR